MYATATNRGALPARPFELLTKVRIGSHASCAYPTLANSGAHQYHEAAHSTEACVVLYVVLECGSEQSLAATQMAG